mmetsp:Transcript_9951/g.8944  ORF Transcript_9951/g.8944 Transcript_9951/m.8944 type:complete len:534 (+) Transcript_9951:61-1662(+)
MLTVLAQMETNDVEQPVIVRTTSSASRHRTRKKSFDTSDFSYQVPDVRTKYYHKHIWTDDSGNIWSGKKPINKLEIENENAGADNKETKDEEEQKVEKNQNVKESTSANLKNKKKKKARIKKILFLEIKIKRISAIDTTSETFRCRFHYYLTWLASKEEYDAWESDRESYEPSWTPKVELTNAAEIHKHLRGSNYSIKSNKSVGFNDEWRINEKYLGFNPRYGKWNRVRFEADITFAEELELEAFPFDCQDLSLYIKVDKDPLEFCDIVPFPRTGDFCLLDPQFSVLSEWYLENLVTEFGFTDPLKSKSLRCYSLVSIHIKASRRWEAHVGMIIVTFCMFSLGLGTFSQSVEPDVLGERLGFCVTFLLADVATLQLMFVHLPNIPYWTILDFYIYTSFIFLFAVTIWSCFAGANYESLDDWDHIAFWVFLSMYIIIHLAYISFSIYYRTREKGKLNMTNSELHDYFKGQRSITDRRAISNAWDQSSLQQCNDDYDNEITGLFFQGAKLERDENQNNHTKMLNHNKLSTKLYHE